MTQPAHPTARDHIKDFGYAKKKGTTITYGVTRPHHDPLYLSNIGQTHVAVCLKFIRTNRE